jgi:two-component sensor histidine kinase
VPTEWFRGEPVNIDHTTGPNGNRRAQAGKTEEAEILLSEMKHRTRNDLQSIASFAALQSRRTGDLMAKVGFEEIGRRAFALAALYDHLLQLGARSEVDLASYLCALCARIDAAQGLEREKIALVSELVATARTDFDTAAELGIIVNELVTNAAKHAFKPGYGGRIVVRLHADPGGTALIVSDDGCGLGTASAETLGLELVHGLIRHRGWQVQQEIGGGTTWRITFGTTRPTLLLPY